MNLFFLLSLAFASVSTHAEDSHCSPMETPLPQQKGQICIYPGEKNADVLYYLHGKDASASIWGENGFWSQQVRDYWTAKGLTAPTVISVSLGEAWLLAPKTGAPGGFGMMDLFIGRIMPTIEAKLGGIKGRRLLLGDSMGGFNSIQLGMKTDLFAKVAALCAPMGDGNVGPFSSPADIDSYVNNSTALRSGHHTAQELKQSFAIIQFVVSQFWTATDWSASDPILLARGLRGPRSAEWYLAAGFFDHYLAYEGNVTFATELAKSGTKVEWRPQWGDHCAVDIPSLAEFLVR